MDSTQHFTNAQLTQHFPFHPKRYAKMVQATGIGYESESARSNLLLQSNLMLMRICELVCVSAKCWNLFQKLLADS